MKSFEYFAPAGGAVHFRGITGSISIIERPVGKTHKVSLNSAKSISGNTLILQFAPSSLVQPRFEDVYKEFQLFFTQNFDAGNRVITKTSVTGADGAKIKDQEIKEFNIGIEIDEHEVEEGKNIWVAVRVDFVGKGRVEIFADGKILNTTRFSSKRTAVKSKSSRLDGVSENHITTGLEEVVAGDAISFGLSLKEIAEIKKLKLTISKV